ncbi:MAG: DUF5683 domain-containing protein [candidate division KSB1 bacterium]|nr:DUF5683 domain-containing protein [candidate division KSB1 bacterium]
MKLGPHQIFLAPLSLWLSLTADSAMFAQTNTQAVSEMRNAFQQLNYAAAKKAGERALQHWQRLTPQQVIEVHQVLAVIAYSEGDFFEAKSQFEQALSLAPDLKLDSLYVSPKIHQFLDQLKANLALGNGHSSGTIRYLVIPDVRPQAALRSLVLPGLGQLHKNQTSKGRLLMAGAGAGVVLTAALHLRREKARENYLSAATIAKAETTYRRYNTLNRARNLSALLTSGIWVYSFFDALASPAAQPPPAVSLLPLPTTGKIVAGLSWQVSF